MRVLVGPVLGLLGWVVLRNAFEINVNAFVIWVTHADRLRPLVRRSNLMLEERDMRAYDFPGSLLEVIRLFRNVADQDYHFVGGDGVIKRADVFGADRSIAF